MNKDEYIDGFPYDIEDEMGEIQLVQNEVPGVYYILLKTDGCSSVSQYYIVEKSSPVISMAAKKYGKSLRTHNDLLAFDIEDASSGHNTNP